MIMARTAAQEVRRILQDLFEPDARTANKICEVAQIPNRQYLGRFLSGQYSSLPTALRLRALLNALNANPEVRREVAEATGYSTDELRPPIKKTRTDHLTSDGLPPATSLSNILLLADVRNGQRDALRDQLIQKAKESNGYEIMASGVYGPYDLVARIRCQGGDASRLVRWLYTKVGEGTRTVPGLPLIRRTETLLLLDNAAHVDNNDTVMPKQDSLYVVVLLEAPVALRRGALIDWFRSCALGVKDVRSLQFIGAWILLGRWDAMMELFVSPGPAGQRELHRFVERCCDFQDDSLLAGSDDGTAHTGLELQSMTLIGTKAGSWKRWGFPE